MLPQGRDLFEHAGARKLAIRVAGSKARHVVLLEAHTTSITEALATNEDSAKTLIAAGYTALHSEADKRSLRKNSLQLVFSKTLEKISKKSSAAAKEQASFREATAQTAVNVFQSKTPLPVIASGDLYITIEEALAATRQKLGKDRLVIEGLYEKIARAAMKDLTFERTFLAMQEGHSFSNAIADLASMLMLTPGDRNEREKFLTGLARELGNEKHRANPVHVKELTLLVENLDRVRTEGASDAHFARNALNVIQQGKGLFVVGAAHGLSYAQASLPEQIVLQAGLTEGDVETILPVQTANAALFHSEIGALKKEGKLRPNLVLFDMDSGKDFTAEAWLELAHQLYPNARIPGISRPSPQ